MWAFRTPLKNIRNKAVTIREIDIIACLLSGKAIKSIAVLLGMSPRTVETHIRNIMAKFECHARDHIIDFIEQSGLLLYFKNHYSYVLGDHIFKKVLHKIALLHKPVKLSFLISSHREKELIAERISFYLKLARIDMAIKKKADFPEYIIGIVHEDHKDVLHIFQNHPEGFSEDYVDLGVADEPKIFYMRILNIIQKLLPDMSLDNVISEFEPQLDDIGNQKIEIVEVQKRQRSRFALPILLIAGFFVVGIFVYYMIPRAPLCRSELYLPQKTFVLNRAKLLAKMDAIFSQQTSGIKSVTLVGIGGAGKTTLARLYARSKKYPVVWELDASNKDNLIQSMKNLAYFLSRTPEQKKEFSLIKQITDPTESEVALLFYMKKLLKDASSWLLIFDNVEDFSSIKELYPNDADVWGKGQVIFTTRDINSINTSYIDPQSVLPVETLSRAEAVEFFTQILGSAYPFEPYKVNKFMENIPHFPLDVSISAYYIKNMKGSPEQYLELIKHTQKFDKQQESLLARVNHYSFTRYYIIKTGLTHIIQANPEFARVLFLLCLLDCNAIPKKFLESLASKELVDELIYQLRKNGFITYESLQKTDSFCLHKAVQDLGLVFFDTFLSNDQKVDFISMVITSFKEFDVNIKSRYELTRVIKSCKERKMLAPHLKALEARLDLINVPEDTKQRTRATLYLVEGVTHKCWSHNLLESKRCLLKFFETSQNIAPITQAVALNFLSAVHIDLGENDASLACAQKSLDLCQNIDDTAILRSENLKTIGIVFAERNEFDKANAYFAKALQALSKDASSDIVKKYTESDVYRQLARHYSQYVDKERLNTAKHHILTSLEILNANHSFIEKHELNFSLLSSDIAKRKQILASIYNRLGQFDNAMLQGIEEAEYIFKMAAIDNPQIEADINLSKGETLLRKGRLKQAQACLTDCATVFEKILGPTAGYTWHAKVFRAEVLLRLGKLKEASDDCVSVLNTHVKVHGCYSNVLYCMALYHAAMICHKQNKTQESLKYFHQFFERMQTTFFDQQKSYMEKSFEGNDNIKTCLQHSADIFSSIYGASHPFAVFAQSNAA